MDLPIVPSRYETFDANQIKGNEGFTTNPRDTTVQVNGCFMTNVRGAQVNRLNPAYSCTH